MNNEYSKACTEVLEILKHFSYKDYSKIPKEKIEFYISNMDKNYNYSFNAKIPLSEQYISKEANTILISIFRDFFADEKQKIKLKDILRQNQLKLEEQMEKYSSNNLHNEKQTINNIKKENSLIEIRNDKWYEKIFLYFRNFLKR